MSTPHGTPPQAWYPDPGGSGKLRWWDGSQWTDQLAGREELQSAADAAQAAEAEQGAAEPEGLLEEPGPAEGHPQEEAPEGTLPQEDSSEPEQAERPWQWEPAAQENPDEASTVFGGPVGGWYSSETSPPERPEHTQSGPEPSTQEEGSGEWQPSGPESPVAPEEPIEEVSRHDPVHEGPWGWVGSAGAFPAQSEEPLSREHDDGESDEGPGSVGEETSEIPVAAERSGAYPVQAAPGDGPAEAGWEGPPRPLPRDEENAPLTGGEGKDRRSLLLLIGAAVLILLVGGAILLLGGGDPESREESTAAPRASSTPSATSTPSDTPSDTPSGTPSDTPAPTPTESPAPSSPAPPAPSSPPTAEPTSTVAICTAAREAQSLRPRDAELTPEVIAAYGPYVTALEKLTAALPEPLRSDSAQITEFNRQYAQADPDNPVVPTPGPELQGAAERLAVYLEETC